MSSSLHPYLSVQFPPGAHVTAMNASSPPQSLSAVTFPLAPTHSSPSLKGPGASPKSSVWQQVTPHFTPLQTSGLFLPCFTKQTPWQHREPSVLLI